MYLLRAGVPTCYSWTAVDSGVTCLWLRAVTQLMQFLAHFIQLKHLKDLFVTLKNNFFLVNSIKVTSSFIFISFKIENRKQSYDCFLLYHERNKNSKNVPASETHINLYHYSFPIIVLTKVFPIWCPSDDLNYNSFNLQPWWEL